jgi:hypothetical protein
LALALGSHKLGRAAHARPIRESFTEEASMNLLAPRPLLHLEGAALLAAAVAVYFAQGGGWLMFVVLLLAPDLAAIGYLANVRVGSALYNLAHTTTLPLALLLVAFLTGAPLGVSLALIWLAHIGLDRLLGYGLKYPTTFKDTHLNRV